MGTGPGQVPPGATIKSAILIMYNIDQGAEDEYHLLYNMLVPWDEDTVTYSTFGADGPTAGTHYAETPCIGTTNGGGEFAPWGWNIAPMVQAYADGLPNNGFIFVTPYTTGDGVCLATSEADNITPLLEVVTADGTYVFQKGVNGYRSLRDTTIVFTDTESDVNFGHQPRLLLDANDDGTIYIGLICFDDIFGPGAGQIPPGTQISSASLFLTFFNQGDPFVLSEVIKPWYEMTVTWDNWVEDLFYPLAGVEIGEAVVEYDTTSGVEFAEIDVTSSLQKWSTNPTQNLGWILDPGGGDGVEFLSNEASGGNNAPMLIVTYESDTPNPDGEVRTVSFQQRRNGYTGAVDIEIWEIEPDTVLEGGPHFWWDAEYSGGYRLGLMQFKDIIGTGPYQIPPGAEILTAPLVTFTIQDGETVQLFTYYNVLDQWDAATTTWNTAFGGDLPMAGTHYAVSPSVEVIPGSGERCLWSWDLAPLIQAYADGMPNNGFVTVPDPNSTNGVANVASEVVGKPMTPTLIVETAAGTFSFTQGVNGYTGLRDTEIRSDWEDDQEPIWNFGSAPTILLDFNSDTDFKAALIQFDDIFGTDAGQIPPGTQVTSAILRITCVNAGDPIYVEELLKPFDENTVTYENWVEDGVFPQVEVEIGDVVAEISSGTIAHSYVEIDVTTSLQKWTADPSKNLGWFLEITASDGFVFMSKDSAPIAEFAPTLIVTYRTEAVGLSDWMFH